VEGCRLESACVVRQGLAENPPRVTRAHLREFPQRWPLGKGVFVLTEEEWRAEQLDEDAVASAAARPYVPLAWVGRYRLGPPTGQSVPQRNATACRLLYLTPTTAPALEPGTPLHRHLARFLPLLVRRREVQRGALAWWHLHWPRREELFQQPRILAVQFGRRPAFVYAAEPTYVGFSINVIQARPEAACWSLPALTGILNSDRWAAWFARRAKLRGAGLEINGHLLRRVPLPDPDPCADAALARLVQQRQAAACRDGSPDIERAIERLVEELRCRRLESAAE
jgi:adenine-specific DNA-methyltransferase